MRYHACVYVNGSSRVKYEVTENPFKIPKYVRVQALDGCRIIALTFISFVAPSCQRQKRKETVEILFLIISYHGILPLTSSWAIELFRFYYILYDVLLRILVQTCTCKYLIRNLDIQKSISFTKKVWYGRSLFYD